MSESASNSARRNWLIGLVAIIVINVSYPIIVINYLNWNLDTIIFIYYIEFGITIFFALLKALFCGNLEGANSFPKAIAIFFKQIFVVSIFGVVYLTFYVVAGFLVFGMFSMELVKVEETGLPILAFAAIEVYRVVLFFINRDYSRYGEEGTGRVIFKPHIKLMLVTGTMAFLAESLKTNTYVFIMFVGVKILVDILADYVENAPPSNKVKAKTSNV